MKDRQQGLIDLVSNNQKELEAVENEIDGNTTITTGKMNFSVDFNELITKLETH